MTELVTGIDLVEEMIRVAAGGRAHSAQKAIRPTGWAIRRPRLYAEDPDRNFLPSIGRLRRLSMPQETAGDVTVRVDTGVVEGSEISRFYDPMIAKVVTHGPDRTAATEAMLSALDHVAIEGIRHNGAFLSALLAHPRWASGRLSTGFIREEFPDRASAPLTDAARRTMAVVAFAEEAREAARRRGLGPHPSPEPGALSAIFDDDVRVDGTVAAEGEVWRVSVDGVDHAVVRAETSGARVWEGRVDGRPVVMGLHRTSRDTALSWRGMRASVKVRRPRVADLTALMPKVTAADRSSKVVCPMPGLVVSLAVVAGAEVEDGQPLAVIEAMKMENVIRAERSGRVKAVHVSEGDSLAVDAVILEFE